MKKVILSLSLIFSFATYAFYTRMAVMNVPVALEPKLADTTTSNPKFNPNLSPTPTPAPKPTPTPTPPPIVPNTGKYKNGSYAGNNVDAYYGNVQVKAIIYGGKIVDVQFLDYPQDRQNSIRINTYAMPRLVSEAISVQDSNVNAVSGASFTSAAYVESLSSALAQARI